MSSGFPRLFLHSRLSTMTPAPLMTSVMANTSTASPCSPAPSASPPMVEVMTDGILATPEMASQVENRMRVRPMQYDRISFGVPGIKNTLHPKVQPLLIL